MNLDVRWNKENLVWTEDLFRKFLLFGCAQTELNIGRTFLQPSMIGICDKQPAEDVVSADNGCKIWSVGSDCLKFEDNEKVSCPCK